MAFFLYLFSYLTDPDGNDIQAGCPVFSSLNRVESPLQDLDLQHSVEMQLNAYNLPCFCSLWYWQFSKWSVFRISLTHFLQSAFSPNCILWRGRNGWARENREFRPLHDSCQRNKVPKLRQYLLTLCWCVWENGYWSLISVSITFISCSICQYYPEALLTDAVLIRPNPH